MAKKKGDNPGDLKEVGVKYDNEKLPLSLISPIVIADLANDLGYGKIKYEARNWERGIDHERLWSGALRHMLLHAVGEDIDEESGVNHITMAIFNLHSLRHLMVTRPDLDFRQDIPHLDKIKKYVQENFPGMTVPKKVVRNAVKAREKAEKQGKND